MRKTISGAVAAVVLIAAVAYVAMNPDVISRLTGSVTGATQSNDLASSGLQPLEFYVKVEGTVQGWIKGDARHITQADWIRGYAYEQAVTSPRDASTGLATGKRQHEPISFLKAVDIASPKLQTAQVNNENLKLVTFQFLKVDPATGKLFVYYEVKLTGATVSSMHAGDTLAPSTAPYETVSFSYQKIEWLVRSSTSAPAVTAVDNWQ